MNPLRTRLLAGLGRPSPVPRISSEEILARGTAVMLFIGGRKSSFRCICSANVFSKLSNTRYRCNGCHREYESDSL